jgi:hypothetical protein
MSSGNYDGLDIITFANELAGNLKNEPVNGQNTLH